MRRIIILLAILAAISFTTIFVQHGQLSAASDEDAINQKLDQILKNQAEMLDYLKFIKNRSR